MPITATTVVESTFKQLEVNNRLIFRFENGALELRETQENIDEIIRRCGGLPTAILKCDHSEFGMVTFENVQSIVPIVDAPPKHPVTRFFDFLSSLGRP